MCYMCTNECLHMVCVCVGGGGGCIVTTSVHVQLYMYSCTCTQCITVYDYNYVSSENICDNFMIYNDVNDSTCAHPTESSLAKKIVCSVASLVTAHNRRCLG